MSRTGRCMFGTRGILRGRRRRCSKQRGARHLIQKVIQLSQRQRIMQCLQGTYRRNTAESFDSFNYKQTISKTKEKIKCYLPEGDAVLGITSLKFGADELPLMTAVLKRELVLPWSFLKPTGPPHPKPSTLK